MAFWDFYDAFNKITKLMLSSAIFYIIFFWHPIENVSLGT